MRRELKKGVEVNLKVIVEGGCCFCLFANLFFWLFRNGFVEQRNYIK